MISPPYQKSKKYGIWPLPPHPNKKIIKETFLIQIRRGCSYNASISLKAPLHCMFVLQENMLLFILYTIGNFIFR